MEKKLVEELFKRYEIKTTSGKSLSIDGAMVTPKKVKDYVTVELAKSCLETDEMLKFYERKDEETGELYANIIKKRIKDRKLAEAGLAVKGDIKLDRKNTYRFRSLTPIIDVKSNEKALFDNHKGQISELNFDAWYEEIGMDKDIQQDLIGNRIHGLITYDPYTTERHGITSFNEQDIYQFNSHIFPEWRFDEVKAPTPPQFFFSLMEHLFPNKGARQFVYYWMRNAIYSRNQTVLLLSSNMGTGKGTLTDILEGLVGSTNYQKQGEGFFQTRFNAELKNKRVVLFDEVTLDKRTKEQLKLFCNNTIPIEKKGIDVAPASTNYASYIVANNYRYENKLVADDRRFSVPEITDIPLLDVFSEEEVNQFHRELEYNPEVVKQIGWWLKENGDLPTWDVHTPYKREGFFQLVKNSLHEWQKFVIDLITNKEADEYSLDEVKEDYEELTGSKRFPSGGKMDSFLSQYKERDGNTIAECVKEKGSYKILPTDQYKRSTNDFMDI